MPQAERSEPLPWREVPSTPPAGVGVAAIIPEPARPARTAFGSVRRAAADVARSYGVSRVPALVLEGQGNGSVRYFGAPAGYEFATLIQDLQSVSKGEGTLSPETRDALAEIADPIHIQVFVTPT